MTTAVFLTKQQAALFILLSKANVFDIRGGSFEVFVDSDGTPSKVKTTQYTSLSTMPVTDTLTVVV